MQCPGKEGKRVYTFGPDHMTKMAPMLIYRKNLKNLFQILADCLETWNVFLVGGEGGGGGGGWGRGFTARLDLVT